MGGNYSRSVYNQLMEVMERLDSVEAEHKKDRKEITSLTREVNGLRRENTCLREEVSELREKTAAWKRIITDWKKKTFSCVMIMSG